jgi:hypothetical protein
LDDTVVAHDFWSLLPLTVPLADFHGAEKIADLPRALDTDEAPPGTAAAAGDLTYYSPWGNLAIFYRDSEHAPGLVRLGSLAPSAVGTIAAAREGIRVTIEVAT